MGQLDSSFNRSTLCALFLLSLKGKSMIGIILVTHNNIGGELLKAVDSIVGPQKQVQAITIGPHDDMASCRDQIFSAIKTVNTGEGVVLLADMFGGTPSNLAIASMPLGHAVVLAGVNLPMLIKLASVRVGEIVLNDVDGLVHQQDMPMVLLGMRFLNRMEMQRDGQTMTLKQRY